MSQQQTEQPGVSASLQTVYQHVRNQRDAATDQVAFLLAEREETRAAIVSAQEAWAGERAMFLGLLAEHGIALPGAEGVEPPVEVPVTGDVDGAPPEPEPTSEPVPAPDIPVMSNGHGDESFVDPLLPAEQTEEQAAARSR